MKYYLDSAVIIKLYVLEHDSAQIQALVQQAPHPIIYSDFHRLEVLTAIRLKRFRSEIDDADLYFSLGAIESDLSAGILEASRCNLRAVVTKAEDLSAQHGAALGTRSLDILHVAFALQLGCDTFVSLDKRQRDLASVAGLVVLPP